MKLEKYVIIFTLFLSVVGTLFFIQSCRKENITPIEEINQRTAEDAKIILDQVWDEISKKAPDVTYEKCLDALMLYSNSRNCYSTIDLTAFLVDYTKVCEDYIPTANTDVQDYNDTWEYRSYVRDPIDSTANNSDIIPLSVDWNVNGEQLTTNGDLYFVMYNNDPINGTCASKQCLDANCNGTQPFNILVTLEDYSQYYREGVGNFNPSDDPFAGRDTCEVIDLIGISTYDFDCPCPIKFEPYQFMVTSCSPWDLNMDGRVNSGDLTILLSNFCS